MGSFFRNIFALTTIFSLACCYELPFGIVLPMWLDSFGLGPGTDDATRSFSEIGDLKSPTLTEQLTKISWDLVGYMTGMLGSITRRHTLTRPNVELAPGAIKTHIPKYPDNYFVSRLKTLLKIKEREEELNKPLNKPE